MSRWPWALTYPEPLGPPWSVVGHLYFTLHGCCWSVLCGYNTSLLNVHFYFVMCLSFWRWGSLGMWHYVIGRIVPDASEDCSSSSASSSQRRLNSSCPAWPWRYWVLVIQWQSAAFQETCIICSTTMRTSDHACGNDIFLMLWLIL